MSNGNGEYLIISIYSDIHVKEKLLPCILLNLNKTIYTSKKSQLIVPVFTRVRIAYFALFHGRLDFF